MRAPVFRSSSPMQNPCSSSPFFLSLSKNYSKTMMKIECKMGVYWVLHMSRYLANIKTKQSKNRQKSRRHAKENRTTGWSNLHHGRGAHNGQTVATTTGRGCHWLWWLGFFPCAAFWSFGSSPWAAGFCLSWGILGLFASFFWSPWP